MSLNFHLFSVFYRVSLTVMKSSQLLFICICLNLFLFWKTVLPDKEFLVGSFLLLLLNILNVSFSCLLVSMVYNENWRWILLRIPWFPTWQHDRLLSLYKILSLFVFWHFDHSVSWCGCLWFSPLWNLLSFLDFRLVYFSKFV